MEHSGYFASKLSILILPSLNAKYYLFKVKEERKKLMCFFFLKTASFHLFFGILRDQLQICFAAMHKRCLL